MIMLIWYLERKYNLVLRKDEILVLETCYLGEGTYFLDDRPYLEAQYCMVP